jgi:hypothetical protein
MKRTSSSYGDTFKSLGKANAAAAKAAMLNEAYLNAAHSLDNDDDDFDDELLAGIDATIFNEVQIVDESMDFAGTLQADGGEDADELDLANFGFGDEFDSAPPPPPAATSSSNTSGRGRSADDDDDFGFGFG